MNYWIFQGNPDVFDVDEQIRSNPINSWTVTYNKHRQLMNVGDEVFLWRSKGKGNSVPGIVALSRVSDIDFSYNSVKNEYHVNLEIIEHRLSKESGMLPLHLLKLHDDFMNLRIIKVKTGSNFLLNKMEFTKLKLLWDYILTDDDKSRGEKEGLIKFRWHKYRERKPGLINQAKDRFRNKHGRLYCEVCKFSFEEKYGALGKDFIEVHHYFPLSKVENEVQTKLSDLKLVCSNCHRIIHRGDAQKTYDKLLNIFNSNTMSQK